MSKKSIDEKLDELAIEAKELYATLVETVTDDLLEELDQEELEYVELIRDDLKKIIKRLKPTRKVRDKETGKVKVVARKNTPEFLNSTRKKIRSASKDLVDIFEMFGSDSE